MSEELEALIAYRLNEARESREEAQLLFDSEKYRGAINRAYYAMFYAALALLASRQLVASKHSGVISVFHREFVKTGIISTTYIPEVLVKMRTGGTSPSLSPHNAPEALFEATAVP